MGFGASTAKVESILQGGEILRKALICCVVLLLLNLWGCMVRSVNVPPNSYSPISAINIVQDDYYLNFTDVVDNVYSVRAKGIVASFEKEKKAYLLYVFKGDSSSAKEHWKALVKELGIWKARTYLDFPSSGLYSVSVDGKRIVAWWKKAWFFVAESSADTEKFADHVIDVYKQLEEGTVW